LQEFLYGNSVARPFGERIARDQTVYWQNGLPHTWFLLRQSGYASKDQGVSALFSRPAAMATAQRHARLAQFEARVAEPASASERRTALRELCADAALDIVILARPIEGQAAPEWFDPLRNAPWQLHHCRDLRSDGKPAPSRS
jgi:hypothetical protein